MIATLILLAGTFVSLAQIQVLDKKDGVEIGIITRVSPIGGSIYLEPRVNSAMLKTAKRGDTVKVFKEYLKPFFKVEYKGVTGYLSYGGIVMTSELNQIAEVGEIVYIDERHRRLVDTYGRSKGSRIYKKEIWVGMTKQELIDSMGKPNDQIIGTGKSGMESQWIYRNEHFDGHVVLANEVVIRIRKRDQ